MKRLRRVWVVYFKELRDTLRDRRTVIAMLVVPIVLYPALMVVLLQALRTESGRRQAERYSLCVPTELHRAWLAKVLAREESQRRADESAAEKLSAEMKTPLADGGGIRILLRPEQFDIRVAEPSQSLWDIIIRGKHHAAVILEPPPDPDHLDDNVNRVVQILYRDTDPRSEFVFHQLSRIFQNESDRIIEARVAGLPGGRATLSPLLAHSISTSSPAQQYAKILAMIVPFLLVIMSVTGCMYPAIDLTAGERERGTLETLAVAPVPVGQIIAGKFLVIVTIAMLSTGLNLGSMSAMVHFSKLDRLIESIKPGQEAHALAVERLIQQSSSPPATATHPSDPAAPAPGSSLTEHDSSSTHGFHQKDYLQFRRKLEAQSRQKVGFLISAAPIALLALIPFSVLAAAVMLATCSFARTFKEAQNYMMPVMMAAILPAMVVSYMPTIKLEGLILVIPVANIVALIRELFLGNYQLSALIICLASTCFYAAAAVAVAARLYGHEAVLFSDVGTYKTLLLRRFQRPQSLPWPELAVLVTAVLFPAYFYWQSYLGDPDTGGARFKFVMAASQILIFAVPPIFLCWYLKIDPLQTFSLRAPRPLHLLGGLLIAATIVPVGLQIEQLISKVFPSLHGDTGSSKLQAELLTEGSLLGIILAFAVLPGICEELLFRGFLLAGLRQRLRPLAVIIIVGVVFGLYHVYVEKVPVVSLLGMLLAFICLRTGTIFIPILIHVANNGLALAATRVDSLRAWLGIPADESITTIPFDSRTAIFLAVFLLGLILASLRPARTRTM